MQKDTKNIDIQELDKKRREILRKYKNGAVKGTIFGGIPAVLGVILTFIAGFIGIVLIVMSFFTFFIVWILHNLKINKKVRSDLYSAVVKAINPTFEYSFGEKQLIYEINISGFFATNTNKFVDDAFKVKVNYFNAMFGEMTLKHLHGDGYLHDFIGVFGFVKLNKKHSFTIIYPNDKRKEPLRIKFLEKNADKEKIKQKRVPIENKFDEKFSVWTNDEVEAKTILNEKLQTFLLEKSSSEQIYLAFRNDRMYVGIDGKQPFRLKIKKSIDQNSIKQFEKDLMFFVNLYSEIIALM